MVRREKKGDNDRSIRQKLLTLTSLVLLLAVLTSCGKRGGDPLSYRLTAFTADITGSILYPSGEEMAFSATVVMESPTDEGCREFSVLFHSPDGLAGMRTRRLRDGSALVSRGGVECPVSDGGVMKNIIKIAEMLDPSEEILRISSISGRDAGLPQYDRLTFIETATVSIAVDPHTSFPVKARTSDGEAEISFDVVTAKT